MNNNIDNKKPQGSEDNLQKEKHGKQPYTGDKLPEKREGYEGGSGSSNKKNIAGTGGNEAGAEENNVSRES